jgi:hypothetical protein
VLGEPSRSVRNILIERRICGRKGNRQFRSVDGGEWLAVRSLLLGRLRPYGVLSRTTGRGPSPSVKNAFVAGWTPSRTRACSEGRAVISRTNVSKPASIQISSRTFPITDPFSTASCASATSSRGKTRPMAWTIFPSRHHCVIRFVPSSRKDKGIRLH